MPEEEFVISVFCFILEYTNCQFFKHIVNREEFYFSIDIESQNVIRKDSFKIKLTQDRVIL